MSRARLVITAVTVEKRPVGEVARSYGVARSWIYSLLARYESEGEAAFEPRSRRPRTSPAAISADTVELIIALRKELSGQGLDAGPHTIAWHLEHHHQVKVSPATISRYLTRHGLVTPEPKKRPKSSYIRFAAEQPNERWQSDFIHWHLADGTEVEIVSWLDDHSRLALSVTACPVTTGEVTLATFRAAVAAHGAPASTLTDNGLVYTTRFSGGKGGRNGLENELRQLGVTQKNGRPSHPQTQGKVERFQQTLQKWLRAQTPAATLAQLQAQLDAFTSYYNTHRPHRALPRRSPPAVAYTARPKAAPGDRTAGTHDRVRRDRTGTNGVVTLRHAGSTTSASAGPTPEPTSCCPPATWTSASSTPPPANSSASSPSTPAATTSPPATPADPHPQHPENRRTPDPHVGSGCPRCLETSHGGGGGI
jgi:transposase InsO family protein